MAFILFFIVAFSTTTVAFQSNGRFNVRKSAINMVATNKKAAPPTEKNIFQQDSTKKLIDLMENDPKNFRITLGDQMPLMQTSDIAVVDNYYDGTMPRTKKNRVVAAQTKDVPTRIKVDENYYDLMNTGFDRRFSIEKDDESALVTCAKQTAFTMELGKTKSQQLAELNKQRSDERTGIMKVVPQGLQKFVDYVNSMYKVPKKPVIVKNLFLGSFFSFIVFANTGARSAFMYFVVANLILTSALLTRNMPKVVAQPGIDKKKVVSWSSNAFKTALLMTLACTLSSAIGTILLAFLLPVSVAVKLKAGMIVGMMSTAYFTSFYEVFESKDKGGSRWTKSQAGTLDSDIEAKLAKEVYGNSVKENDMYDYEYNPQVDDYPLISRYTDESEEAVLGGGNGELDEGESLEHFEKWRVWRKESRRPAIEDAPPETAWVGSKKGMYVTKVPTWLSTAYKANVLKANKWRDKPARFIKDTAEFELVSGPFGFRDKFPEWLTIFGNDVWEEKTQQSRKLARAFGTYRKTMWVIDKKVKLLPCDGADKEVDFKK